MTARLLSEILTADHRACDAIFARAEAAARAGDWPACVTAAAQFRAALERHFLLEEDLLFPAFEAAGAAPPGPTRMMRIEHAQMRQLLDDWKEHAAARRCDAFLAASETLLVYTQQHNLKEENVLYPMCDGALRARAVELAAAAEQALQPG